MIFLRHPPAAAAPGLCYGRLDLDCADGADAMIGALLAALPPASAVLSSPARRCRVLADRIAMRDGLRVAEDERLWELDFGTWEGRQWSAIPRTESDPWAADPERIAPPGGETFAALRARTAAALADAPAEAVIVTHAGVIRAARMIQSGTSFAEVFAAPVPYCAPIPLTATGALDSTRPPG